MEKAKQLYIIIPGGVSGDLWHVAAAQILSNNYADYKLIAVVTVAAEDKGVDLGDNKDFQQGRVTFNFLRDLGLDVILAIVPKPKALNKPAEKPKGLGKVPLENVMYRQDPAELGKIFSVQSGMRPNRFDDFLFQADGQIVPNLPVPASVDDQPEVFFATKPEPPTGNTPLLQLMTATTIAIQHLYKMPQKRREELATKMASGISNETQTDAESSDKGKMPDNPGTDRKNLELPKTYNELQRKYEEFSGKAKAAMKFFNEQKASVEGAPKDVEYAQQVVLYNNRRGEVNRGTDSVEAMRIWFYKEAWKKDLAVVEIATGLEKGDIKGIQDEYQKKKQKGVKEFEKDMQAQRFVFDIYDKERDASYPGLNPALQAALWHEIGTKVMVFGMFSGRTGSADIAAFAGLNTFFWDDPNMQFLIGEAAARFTVSNRTAKGLKDFLDGVPSQIPQCMRSLLLYPIMGVGQPMPAPTKLSDLGGMRKTPFQNWMNGLKPWGKEGSTDNSPSVYPSFTLDSKKPAESAKVQPVLSEYVKSALASGPEDKKGQFAKKSVEAVQQCSFEMFLDGYIERKQLGIIAQALHDLQIFPGTFPKKGWEEIYDLDVD